MECAEYRRALLLLLLLLAVVAVAVAVLLRVRVRVRALAIIIEYLVAVQHCLRLRYPISNTTYKYQIY